MREHHRFALNRPSRSPLANRSNLKDGPREMCPVSSKRDLDNQKANISKLNTEINELLGFVKAKTKQDHNQSTEEKRANSGLEDYRRRISYLENIQEIQNMEKEEIIMRPTISDRKYVKNVRWGGSEEDEYEIRPLRTKSPIEIHRNYKRDENDQIPFSKPSENQFKEYPNRTKSPLAINRPHSKYIARLAKQQNKIEPNHQEASIQLEKEVYEKYQSPIESHNSKKFSYFNSKHISEEASNLTDKSEIIESNKNSFVKNENSEPSIQIERTRTFHEYFKELDILDDIRNENGEQADHENIKSSHVSQKENEYQSHESKEQQNKSYCETQNEKESLKIGQIEKESNDLMLGVQESEQERDLSEYGEVEEEPYSPYEKSFELKVYPCDLNRETVRTFIADRFAKVVKIDVEFMELKKLFLENSFDDKIELFEKKEKLVKCLWSRGYLINEKDIESVINFDIPVCPALLSSEERLRLKNFDFFIEAFVDKYLQAEFEWEKKVLGMLSQNEIIQTGFKPAKIDLEGKGYLKLEDVTCFVNLYADDSPCFKNMAVKDLFLRFCRGEKNEGTLSYEEFMNKLCMANV